MAQSITFWSILHIKSRQGCVCGPAVDSDEGIPQPYVSQMKVWASPGVIASLLPERTFCFELEEWHGRTKGGDSV